MLVNSVHIGEKKPLNVGQRRVLTGISKSAVTGRVSVGAEGLENDAICDRRHHGGPDQALYIYRQEDYAFWKRQYRADFAAGGLGENLVVSGLDTKLMIGDRLIFSDLALEVSAPRIPCGVLGAAVSHSGFAAAFQKAERPGFYCRVLRSGTIGAGDRAELQCPYPMGKSVLDLFRANYLTLDEADLETFLSLPIDRRTRRKFEARILKLRSIPRPPK